MNKVSKLNSTFNQRYKLRFTFKLYTGGAIFYWILVFRNQNHLTRRKAYEEREGKKRARERLH